MPYQKREQRAREIARHAPVRIRGESFTIERNPSHAESVSSPNTKLFLIVLSWVRIIQEFGCELKARGICNYNLGCQYEWFSVSLNNIKSLTKINARISKRSCSSNNNNTKF